tara:strand:- start:514 stop:831 length:318 start_codon:yes stop_codon:yes gene_type:complete
MNINLRAKSRIIKQKIKAEQEKTNPTQIKGKNICITGKLSTYSRFDITTTLKLLGANIQHNVTAATDILVWARPYKTTTKVTAAQKHKTTILKEDEFHELLQQSK